MGPEGGVGHNSTMGVPLQKYSGILTVLQVSCGGPAMHLRGSFGPGATNCQVWTRHLAPAAPAPQPSSPLQFQCMCRVAAMFAPLCWSLTSLVRVSGGQLAAASGLYRLLPGFGPWLYMCVPCWLPLPERCARCRWPHSATHLTCYFHRVMEGLGSVSGQPGGLLSPIPALYLVLRIEKPQWVQVFRS